jgi:hypothetical protein
LGATGANLTTSLRDAFQGADPVDRADREDDLSESLNGEYGAGAASDEECGGRTVEELEALAATFEAEAAERAA